MAIFNGRNWTVADMQPYKYVENWDDFFDDVIVEMEARAAGIGGLVAEAQSSAASAGQSQSAADADRQATAADRQAVASDRATMQGLLTQAQAAQAASANAAQTAQQWIGTATDVIAPAINLPLASAWDANGQPTAYGLAGVVAVLAHDSRRDPDGGAWRLGAAARAASWWNDALSTATRGQTREYPVVALYALTATRLVIYDARSRDTTGSPRMWRVIPFGPSATDPLSSLATYRGLRARAGQVAVASTNGVYLVDWARDTFRSFTNVGAYAWSGSIAVGNGYAKVSDTGLISSDVYAVDLCVMPGAPLDPVTRLPGVTIAAATAGGTSVVHPTGLIAHVTLASGHNCVRFSASASELMVGRTGMSYVWVGRVPYATVTDVAWATTKLSGDLVSGDLQIGYNQVSTGLAETALGRAAQLTLLMQERGKPAASLVAYVAHDWATGWLPADTRLAALCEGAARDLVGGELLTNGAFAADTGWTKGGGWAIASGAATHTAGAGGHLYASVAILAGETYQVGYTVRNRTAGALMPCLLLPNSPAQTNGPLVAANGTYQAAIKAIAGQTVLSFYADGTFVGDLDDVSCRLAVADRSSKSAGLLVVGTLQRAALVAGADLGFVSGWSDSAYLQRALTSDLTLAADFAVGLLLAHVGYTLYRVLVSTYNGDLYPYYELALNVDHTVTLVVADGGGVDTLSTAAPVAANKLTSIWAGRRGNRLEIWVDGRLAASKTTARTASIVPAWPLLVGRRGVAVPPYPATGVVMALVRLAGTIPTPPQLARMAADELTAAATRMYLGGASDAVQAVAQEEAGGVVAVATADGVDRFAGLRRIAHHSSAAGTAITAASVTSLSIAADVLVAGTAAGAGVITEAVRVRDELRPAPWGDIIWDGVTVDATPLDLGRVFVGEGETLLIEANVQATEYGLTPSEGGSYVVRARVRRGLGGNVTLAAAPVVAVVDETTASMDATVTVDTTAQTAALTVTGKAGTRLRWKAVATLTWIGGSRNVA